MDTALERLQAARAGASSGDGQSSLARLQAARAASPRADEGLTGAANVAFGGTVEGIPIVGPTLRAGLDRTGAMIRSQISGKPYEEELAFVQGQTQALREQHPVLDVGGQIAGSILGIAPFVAAAPTLFGLGSGGLFARTALGRTALGRSLFALGGGLFERTVFGAGSGAIVGAADVAARGGDPVTGAAYGAGGGAAGVLLAGLLGRAFAKRAATPTSQALKAQAGPLFERAKTAGVVAKIDPYRSAVAKMAADMKAEGLDSILHPKASRALVRLQEATGGGQIDLQELTTLRRIVGAAANSIDADERRVASIMVDHLDDFMAKLGPSDVLAGDPKAASATLREARELWTRYRRTEIIEDALERAERLMATGVTEGTAIRGQFRRIANNAKLLRKFGKDEKAAIKAVAKEDNLAEALKLIGGLRGMVVGGALGSILGPVGSGGAAGGLMAVGMTGRAVAGRSARRAAETVQELASTGSVTKRPASETGRLIGQTVGLSAGFEAGRSGGADDSRGARQ